jgi:hypothetical protein
MFLDAVGNQAECPCDLKGGFGRVLGADPSRSDVWMCRAQKLAVSASGKFRGIAGLESESRHGPTQLRVGHEPVLTVKARDWLVPSKLMAAMSTVWILSSQATPPTSNWAAPEERPEELCVPSMIAVICRNTVEARGSWLTRSVALPSTHVPIWLTVRVLSTSAALTFEVSSTRTLVAGIDAPAPPPEEALFAVVEGILSGARLELGEAEPDGLCEQALMRSTSAMLAIAPAIRLSVIAAPNGIHGEGAR